MPILEALICVLLLVCYCIYKCSIYNKRPHIRTLLKHRVGENRYVSKKQPLPPALLLLRDISIKMIDLYHKKQLTHFISCSRCFQFNMREYTIDIRVSNQFQMCYSFLIYHKDTQTYIAEWHYDNRRGVPVYHSFNVFNEEKFIHTEFVELFK